MKKTVISIICIAVILVILGGVGVFILTSGGAFKVIVYSHHEDVHHGHVAEHSPYAGNAVDAGTYIGEDEAKSIALDHAGFSTAEVSFSKVELGTDDGQIVYEIEFYKDGREYEYTINASTGSIIEYEVE